MSGAGPLDGRSNRERMLAGERYQPVGDAELDRMTQRAQQACLDYNALGPRQLDERRQVLDSLLASLGTDSEIRPPFWCDYGVHIEIGERFFANYGLVVLDGAPVTIGDRVFLGPNVQILTASHPTDPAPRGQGWETAHPITIGDDVWIGGGAILCPGVTVGSGSTVGAGSVVTRDVPRGVVAVGNPCRPIHDAA